MQRPKNNLDGEEIILIPSEELCVVDEITRKELRREAKKDADESGLWDGVGAFPPRKWKCKKRDVLAAC
jgi:hypothetical protein